MTLSHRFHSAIRSLLRKRSQIETKHVKQDIVQDYSKYESNAYGPLTREGYFPDKLTDKYVVKSRFLDTYMGLLELESTLPSNALKIRLPAPKRITSTKEGHLKRQFRRERDLNNIFEVRFLKKKVIRDVFFVFKTWISPKKKRREVKNRSHFDFWLKSKNQFHDRQHPVSTCQIWFVGFSFLCK